MGQPPSAARFEPRALPWRATEDPSATVDRAVAVLAADPSFPNPWHLICNPMFPIDRRLYGTTEGTRQHAVTSPDVYPYRYSSSVQRKSHYIQNRLSSLFNPVKNRRKK